MKFGGPAVVVVAAAGLAFYLLKQVSSEYCNPRSRWPNSCWQDDCNKNVAFVFIKPHACTPETKALVKAELAKRGISIRSEGEILGTVIDEKKYIDQHYYSIASKATLMEPQDLPVPADKFQAKFNIPWATALQQGVVFNAAQACKQLNITPAQLDAKWGQAKKSGNLVKFGGGFYCANIDGIYIFNGFFMSMRSKFTGDAKIYYYVTEWESGKLKWEDFRGKVLGPTDPEEGPRDSIRALVAGKWQELGLKAPCNVGDNGVHASASPFEALAEVTNWLEGSVQSEAFGRRMVKAGISEAKIKEWSVDPQVAFEKDGKRGKFSLFDLVEDMDSTECLETLTKVNTFK